MSKVVHIQEFCIEEIPLSCTWIVIGKPASGKTTFIENLCYFNKHKYAVARVFNGTEASTNSYSKFIHPLYITSHFDREEETKHIKRQKAVIATNKKVLGEEEGKAYPGNFAINIIDDCTDDSKMLRDPLFKQLFKLGSQHFGQLFIMGSHYAFELDPGVRDCVSYVAIFNQPEEEMRRKLYKTFGGLTGSFQNFCALMDKFTGDYTCLIICKRTQSTEIEDCIFWYRTQDLSKVPWRFGCHEYNKWAEERYNTNYIDAELEI